MPPAHCCGRGRRRRRGSSRNSGVGVTVALGPRVARRVRGPHGARGFATAFTTRIVDAGTGPRAALLGLGTSHTGGAFVATEGGGGSMQLSTTADAGGISARLS